MRAFLRLLIIAELLCANALGTVGERWEASASERLKRLAGQQP